MSGHWRQFPGAVPAGLAAIWYFLQDTSGIKWGDGLEFAAVSARMGVAHPPGYPLLTLLGAAAMKLPAADPYQGFLLVCKAGAALAVAALYLWLRRVLAPVATKGDLLAGMLAACAAFSAALWPTIHVAEAYSLAAGLSLLTVLLAFPGEVRPARAVACGVVGGLAVAAHLTALAVLPLVALAAWKSGRRTVGIASLAAFFVVPAAFYLSLLLRKPEPDSYGIFWGGMGSFSEWLAHVRGGEYGQFQFLMEQPGRAFTPATWLAFALGRTHGLLVSMGAFAFGRGPVSLVAGLGFLGCAVGGARMLIRNPETRLHSVAVLATMALQITFVYLYNIPDFEDYLLTILLLASVFAAVGVARVPSLLLERLGSDDPARRMRLELLLGWMLLGAALLTNGRDLPPATGEIAEAWRERILAALPEGAAVITAADADSYTLWYTQMAEGKRRDLCVIGGNFVRFPWIRHVVPPDDPRRAVIAPEAGPPPRSAEKYLENLSAAFIEPMLAKGPVYLLVRPGEESLFAQRYQLLPAADLLTERDWLVIEATGTVNFPPAQLWQLRPRNILP